jgi:16S rRNA (cytosine967-C5)-methyltransferase
MTGRAATGSSRARPRPAGPAGLGPGQPARVAAAAAVAAVLYEGVRSATALSRALQAASLDDRDAALATELCYGALRCARPLEASLLRAATKPGRGLDARIRPHLLVAAYQLQHLGERIPAHAAVSAAVAAIKRERPGLEGFSNALLRHLGSPLSSLLTSSSSVADRCVAYGVPLRVGHAIAASLPVEEHAAAIAALQGRPSSWAYLPSAARAQSVAAHDAGGYGATVDTPIDAVVHPLEPGCVSWTRPLRSHDGDDRVVAVDAADGVDPERLSMDPSVALLARLAASSPACRVVELCPGHGAGAIVLADVIGPAGRVIVVEPDDRRAARILEHAQRLGVSERLAVRASAEAISDVDGEPDIDAVCVVAPGTNLGAGRRYPEQLLRFLDAHVEHDGPLSRRQRGLMSQAARLVRPGGRVVYAVTSPLPEEGIHVVEAFLAERPDFFIDAEVLRSVLPAHAIDAGGTAQLWPHRDDVDATFVCCLRRRT